MNSATKQPLAAANIMLIAIIDGIAWNGNMWYCPNKLPGVLEATESILCNCYIAVYSHWRLSVDPQLNANLHIV